MLFFFFFFFFFFAEKYWPLDICKKVVTGNFVRLTRELDTSSIIPVLIQKQILTTDEAYRIISLQSTTEKATYLLTFLPRKGSSGYRELFTALKEDSEQPAHQALGEELEEKCQGKHQWAKEINTITTTKNKKTNNNTDDTTLFMELPSLSLRTDGGGSKEKRSRRQN